MQPHRHRPFNTPFAVALSPALVAGWRARRIQAITRPAALPADAEARRAAYLARIEIELRRG